MIRNLFFVLVVSVGLFACGKSNSATNVPCTTVLGSPTVKELDSIQGVLISKGINNAVRDSRGFYYEVVSEGYGTLYPNAQSTVTVSYKGTLPNGTIFDSTATGQSVTFGLGNVITGWRFGVPLIKKGGIINLYLPPSLGYGCQAQGQIPSGSMLFFNIEIRNF